jgi:hypothetical protein
MFFSICKLYKKILLKNVGIDESSRKVMVNMTTKLSIEKNNNMWSILTENDNGTKNQVNFVSGVEFLECKRLH